MKKRKREESFGTVITCDGEYSGNGLALAVKLYDLIHSSDYLKQESLKLVQQMHLEIWLNPFLNDLAMYKGLHHDLMLRLPQETNTLCAQLRLASTCFSVKDYKVSYCLNTLDDRKQKELYIYCILFLIYFSQ